MESIKTCFNWLLFFCWATISLGFLSVGCSKKAEFPYIKPSSGVAPAAFKMLEPVIVADTATLSWTLSEGADSYALYRGTTIDDISTLLTKDAKSPYVDRNLTPKTNYFYRIIAINSIGQTVADNAPLQVFLKNVDGIDPSATTKLGPFSVTVQASENQVMLQWSSSEYAAFYQVWRSPNLDNFELIQNGATSPFFDKNVLKDHLYYYKVNAILGNEQRWAENMPLGVWTKSPSSQPTLPNAPSRVLAKAGEQSAFISFDVPADGGSPILSYVVKVWQKDSVNESFELINTITLANDTTETTIHNLIDGRPYFFSVAAVNQLGIGQSTASERVIPETSMTIALYAAQKNSALYPSKIQFRAIVKTKAGKIAKNQPISIHVEPTTSGDQILPATVVTNEQGLASFTLSGSTPGLRVVKASIMNNKTQTKVRLLSHCQNSDSIRMKGPYQVLGDLDVIDATASNQIVVADINRDGKQDIITLDGKNLLVALGDDSNQFTTHISVRPNVSGVAYQDIESIDNLTVLPPSTNSLENPSIAYRVFYRDFSGERKRSIGLLDYLPLSRQFQSTDITSTISYSGVVQGIEMGDFNGDTLNDIVMIKYIKDSDSISLQVLIAQADGSFKLGTGTIIHKGIPFLRDIYWADFNNDGKLDVLADLAIDTLKFIPGKGDGTFDTTKATDIKTIDRDSVISLGDFDGDRALDIAYLTKIDANNSRLVHSESFFLFGNGDGTFGNQLTQRLSKNGDVIYDFLIKRWAVSTTQKEWIVFYRQSGIGAVISSLKVTQSGITRTAKLTHSPQSPFFMPPHQSMLGQAGLIDADINADGVSDLIIPYGYADDLKNSYLRPLHLGTNILLTTGFDAVTKTPQFEVVPTVSHHMNSVFLGTGFIHAFDFNQDGRDDIAYYNSKDSQIEIRLNTAFGFSDLENDTIKIVHSLTNFTVGDFDQNGVLDFVGIDYVGNIYTFLGIETDKGLKYEPAKRARYDIGLLQKSPFIVVSMASADFNQDGQLDLILAGVDSYSKTPSLVLFYNDGTGDFYAKKTAIPRSDGTPESLVIQDFNQDGYFDVAVRYSDEPKVNALSVMFNQGPDNTNNNAYGLTQASNYVLTASSTGLVSADFDNDGDFDLLVAQNDDTQAYPLTLLTNNGSGIFTAREIGKNNNQARSLLTGDYNGDGRIDFASVSLRTGTLSVFLGNGAGSFKKTTTALVSPNFISAVNGDFAGRNLESITAMSLYSDYPSDQQLMTTLVQSSDSCKP